MEELADVYRRGQKKKARLVRKIAREPRSTWLEASTGPNPGFEARRRIDAAKAVGAIPVFVVLRAETKRCSRTYQGGGPAADRATRSWYEALARGIGGDRVVIAFEPDSLGLINCLARARRDDRYDLLRRGVDVLSGLPGATVYLEGGASDWESAERTAEQLRMIGIEKVRGFMLNATHYDWTAANIRHGLDISRLVGGKHFIVNTAENGRGPVYYRAKRRLDQHLVQPGPAGPGPTPDHHHVQPLGGRLPLDQPAGLRTVLPEAADRLVRPACARLRALCHRLGEAP